MGDRGLTKAKVAPKAAETVAAKTKAAVQINQRLALPWGMGCDSKFIPLA